MAIERPKTGRSNPDRPLACQEAMEARVQAVMDEAHAAGWDLQEVTTAVMELANNWALGVAANAQTDADIARAKGLKPN